MDRFEPGPVDVRIELRSRDIGVSQHLLDHAQVSALLKQVRREAVAKRVRRYLFSDPSLLGIPLYHLPECLP